MGKLFLAGTTGREGGVSRPPYGSLNLSSSVGDEPGSVEENWRRACGRLGVEKEHIALPRQVHGADCVAIGREDLPLSVTADALVTSDVGVALGILTADCLPIFLWTCPAGGRLAASKRAVGICHAGWRSLSKGIVSNAVRTLTEIGDCQPSDIRASFGPGIGGCCYQVGREVVEALNPAQAEPMAGEKFRLNLEATARAQIIEAGIPPEAISGSGLCTRCREDDFFSYRRDGKRSGRMLSLIVIRGG